MTTEQISCAPGNGNNEDLVAALEGADLTDFLVFDGASSVTDTDYIAPPQGDLAWFVQSFAAALTQAMRPGVTPGATVRRAVEAVRAARVPARVTDAGCAVPGAAGRIHGTPIHAAPAP